jgi:hypothetical protein
MEDFIKDAERVVTFVPKEAAILEVAPGPGYLSIELAKLGNLDISKKFVEIDRLSSWECFPNAF